MVALSFADAADDVRGEDREAEEGSGRDGGGDGIVRVEGDGCDVAGGEAGGGVGVEAPAHPDDEVADEEEGGGGGEDGSGYAEHGGFAAKHLMAEEADGGVPGPGDDVGAGMKGVGVGVDREVVVGRDEGEGGDDGVPAAAPGSEEEQASSDRCETYAGGQEGVRQDAAENGKEKDEIGSHGRPQLRGKSRSYDSRALRRWGQGLREARVATTRDTDSINRSRTPRVADPTYTLLDLIKPTRFFYRY